MTNTNEASARELKRRALRYQTHHLPRASQTPLCQRLTAWLMLILAVALAVVLAGQTH